MKTSLWYHTDIILPQWSVWLLVSLKDMLLILAQTTLWHGDGNALDSRPQPQTTAELTICFLDRWQLSVRRLGNCCRFIALRLVSSSSCSGKIRSPLIKSLLCTFQPCLKCTNIVNQYLAILATSFPNVGELQSQLFCQEPSKW